MNSQSHLLAWIFVLLTNLILAGLAFTRLSDLPDIPIRMGEEMFVQAVAGEMEPGEAGMIPARGDHITGLAGHTLESPSDLVLVTRNLMQASGQNEVVTDYQAIRPLHRFTLTITGQPEGSSLPMGVEPTDVLVEVDGRTLPGKVGPEGLRSIVASRPEAVLGFERRNAVFTGKVSLSKGDLHYAWLLSFLIAGIMTLGLWRFHNRRIHERFSIAMAFQSVLLAAVSIIVFKYQWAVSDVVLTSVVASAMILCRPVAFFGHGWVADERPGAGTWFALALAIVSAVVVSGSIGFGVLSGTRGLLLSGTIGFFFIFYELVAGFSRGHRGDPRAERSLYLVGIIVITVVASLFAYISSPVAFLEIRWVGFVFGVLGLMWTGDVIVSLRGPALSELDEIITQPARHELIMEFLTSVSTELPGCRLRFVLHQERSSVLVGEGLTGFEVRPTDAALHDAMAILVQEQARVPDPLGGDSPLEGITKTMQIPMCFELSPPEGALQVPGLNMILLATWVPRGVEPMPRATLEMMESANQAMTATIWAAALVEGLGSLGAGETTAPEPSISPVVVEELRTKIAEKNDEIQRLVGKTEDLQVRLDAFGSQVFSSLAPSVLEMENLLEPGLLDALTFLLQTPEPIVLAGAHGSGKSFAAVCAAHHDPHFSGPCVVLDMSHFVDASGRSDIDDFPAPVLLAAEGGALLVRCAHLLSSQQIKALINRARKHYRLFLSFDDSDAESHSVLEGHPAPILDLLEHRELVIPSFERRMVRAEVIQHFVERASVALHGRVMGVAADAMEALVNHYFSGQIEECEALIWAAVANAHNEVMDTEDFPFINAR